MKPRPPAPPAHLQPAAPRRRIARYAVTDTLPPAPPGGRRRWALGVVAALAAAGSVSAIVLTPVGNPPAARPSDPRVAQYQQARQSLAQGKLELAVRQLTALGKFRDSPRLRETARQKLAQQVASQAQGALVVGDLDTAKQLAQTALEWSPNTLAETVLDGIAQARQANRRALRAAERRKAARARARARARYRARQRRRTKAVLKSLARRAPAPAPRQAPAAASTAPPAPSAPGASKPDSVRFKPKPDPVRFNPRRR